MSFFQKKGVEGVTALAGHMVEIRKILAPIDLKTPADDAIVAAAELASRFSATLHLLHVFEPEAYGFDPTSPADHDRIELSLIELERRLAQAAALAREAAPIEVVSYILQGSPVGEILGLAPRCDLIVLTTHARAGLERFYLGSVAEKVLRKAPCPVLTLRSQREWRSLQPNPLPRTAIQPHPEEIMTRTSMDHPPSDGETSLRDAMMLEHHQLNDLLGRLSAAFEADAREDSLELWTELEAKLERHFQLEERVFFHDFARSAPAEVAALTREHEQLRRKVAALGVGVDLHLTRFDMVRELIAQLRAHAEREDTVLYRWIDTHTALQRREVRAHMLSAFIPALPAPRRSVVTAKATRRSPAGGSATR